MSPKSRWQVLVVERTPEESVLVQHILEALGSRQFMVTVAVSLAEARAVLDRQSFDVAMVALELIDPNDPDGIRGLRRAASSRALVAVTHTDSTTAEIDRALAAGADAVIRMDEKNPGLILRSLRDLLARAI